MGRIIDLMSRVFPDIEGQQRARGQLELEEKRVFQKGLSDILSQIWKQRTDIPEESIRDITSLSLAIQLNKLLQGCDVALDIRGYETFNR